ncbi:MAG: hypothetical protein U9Q63_00685 [Patescibacteria group bacterium]|nr:hypothetical protein [Patescibacteria group bacterium]
MKKKLPRKFYPYFWEVDPENIQLSKDKHYVIKRLIDCGDTADISWMLKTYGVKSLKNILLKYRGISRKTAVFWSNILNIKQAEVKCLKTPYHRIRFGV